MKLGQLARPGVGAAQAKQCPIPNRRKAFYSPVGRLFANRDSCRSTDEAEVSRDDHPPTSLLRQAVIAVTTAACSGVGLPCHAIVEEKLTGSPAYKPTSTEVGWEVIVGAVVATIPLIVASYEFGKRILIQQRCPACKGSGLISRGRYLRKCSRCGGFLPWQGWKAFFLSTANPGNGGPLRQPRGQTGIFYKVPPKQLEAEKESQQRQRSRSSLDDTDAASDTST